MADLWRAKLDFRASFIVAGSDETSMALFLLDSEAKLIVLYF